jgi:hypothetical protein
MEKIEGKYCLLESYNDGNWVQWACARSCTFISTVEYIETTVTGAGKDKHFTPTVNSFIGTIEGISVFEDGSTDFLALSQLRIKQLGHELQRVRYLRGNKANTLFYTTAADFYISEISDTSSFDNVNTFNINLIGTGVPDHTIITPPTIITKVKRFEYAGTGGEVSFTSSTLINKDILSVVKDGLGQCRIITSGSPASKEVKYTTGTGQFTFAVQFEAGEPAYVIYQDM